MANYNKSFNFKNGVQVDVDKFIVRGSLVGIGTSIPGELFDVNGNMRVAGLVTSQNLNVSGIATFNQVRVGAVQLSATSGVITATAFYGNGATLSNLPTSQWVDVDVGLGFTSIYAAGNVGVNTLDPRFSLQIGANPLQPYGASPLFGGISPYNLPGVGINSNGNIVSTGIISARSFAGAGAAITSLNADNITVGSINNSILPVIPNDKLGPNLQLGIITATNAFVGNLTGTATTALSLTGSINIIVGFVTSVNLDVGIISAQNMTVFNTFGVGIGSTVFYAQHSGKVGIGSTTPQGTVDINAPINATLNVISRNNEAKISIGQSSSGQNYAGVLRFGNPTGVFDIINRAPGNMNFILHNGGLISGFTTGAFNWKYGQTSQDLMTLTKEGYLGLGNTQPSRTLEVVGLSSFSDDAYFESNVTINGSLQVASVTFGSNINNVNFNTTSGLSTFYTLNLGDKLFTTNGIGINTTSLYSGVALDASSSTALFNGVGIGTTIRSNPSTGVPAAMQIKGGSLFSGSIGVNTVIPANTTNEINIYNQNINLYSTGYKGDSFGGILVTAIDTNIVLNGDSNIAIGTFSPNSAFDLSGIARATSSPGTVGQPGQAYMILPKLNPTERSNLVLVSGGLIYNTTTNQMQIYNGSAWNNVTHTDGNSGNAGFSTFARWSGISTIASVAGFATVATQAGVATLTPYAYTAGFSTYSGTAGFSTISAVAGFATNATRAGLATLTPYSYVAGFSTYAGGVGFATFAGVAGFSTYAGGVGFATFAGVAGFATVAIQAGVSTIASVAGFATVATQAGISTSVINGVANVTSLNVNPGVSTVGVLTASGSIFDVRGNVRTLPQNAQVAAYVAATTDVGKHIAITIGGVTINANTFTIGDILVIYNNSDLAQTISRQNGTVTLRLAGTAGSQASYNLAARGIVNILCVASNEFVAYGDGVT